MRSKILILLGLVTVVGCVKNSDNENIGYSAIKSNTKRLVHIKTEEKNVYMDTTLAWYGEGSGMVGVTHENPFEYQIIVDGMDMENIKIEIKQGDEVIDIVNRIKKLYTRGGIIYIRPSAKMDKGTVRDVIDRWGDTIREQDYIIKINEFTIMLTVKQNTLPKAFLVYGTYARDYWAYSGERDKAPWRQKYWEDMRAIPYYGWDDSVYVSIQYPYGYNNLKQNDADNIYGDEVDFFIENPKNGEMVYLNDYFREGTSEGFEWYFINVGDYYSLNTYCPQFKYAVGDKYPKIKDMSMNYLYNVLGESTRAAEDAMIFFHIVAKDKYGGVSDFWISNTERGSNQDQFCIYNGKLLRKSFNLFLYYGGWMNSSLDDREKRGYPRGKDVENIKYWLTHSFSFKERFAKHLYIKDGEMHRYNSYSRYNNTNNNTENLIINLKEITNQK